MTPRDQLDLFDDADAAARPSLSVPVAVPRGAAPLTREQKAFNRLAARVQRLREEVRTWEDYAARYNQRIAGEIEPASERMRAAQRRLVLRLHALLEASARGDRLSRAHRHAVRQHVAWVAAEVLAGGPDPEVEAVHDACADTAHAEQTQAELEDLEAILGLVLGEEAVAGHAAHSADELFMHARERVEVQTDTEAQQRAQRRGKGSTRAQQAAARKARARDEAFGTVRAIYRKLASAVHPDREADPEARARKTLLMQRANEAYARDDVLTLLELQIELGQIDTEHLAGAPAQRLEHLVAIMKEQAATLQAEFDGRVEHFRVLLDRPYGKLRPAMVECAIDEQLADMHDVTRSIEADLAPRRSPPAPRNPGRNGDRSPCHGRTRGGRHLLDARCAHARGLAAGTAPWAAGRKEAKAQAPPQTALSDPRALGAKSGSRHRDLRRQPSGCGQVSTTGPNRRSTCAWSRSTFASR